MGVHVVAVDIGSVGQSSKFAWAAFDAPGRDLIADGTDPETAVSGWCPACWRVSRPRCCWRRRCRCRSLMASPVRGAGWGRRGRERATGPGRREPSAAALATGLAQGAWMLRHLATSVPGLAATTQPASWQRSGAQLLLAEAFITAAGKPEPLPTGQDAADAAAAGLALAKMLDGSAPLISAVRCAPQDPFNLLAAMALWARLRIDLAELHAEVSSLLPVLCRRRHARECRVGQMDDLAHFRTERIVGA